MPIKESGAASGSWVVISIVPDVCKSPSIPVPYPIVGFLSDEMNASSNVRFASNLAFHMGSRVTRVIGDEAGVGGGVTSGVNMGYCRPISHNPTLRVNGNHVLNHQMAYFEMNCADPDSPGNTIGLLHYSGFMGAATVGADGKIPPGDPAVTPETPAEKGFVDSLVDKADGLLSAAGGLEGAVALGKQAYSLATMDWSNPAAVLGAIGGVAGLAGLGEVAQIASLAQTGYGLATTDFSNPGAVVGAAVNIAGAGLMASNSNLFATDSSPTNPNLGTTASDGADS